MELNVYGTAAVQRGEQKALIMPMSVSKGERQT